MQQDEFLEYLCFSSELLRLSPQPATGKHIALRRSQFGIFVFNFEKSLKRTKGEGLREANNEVQDIKIEQIKE